MDNARVSLNFNAFLEKNKVKDYGSNYADWVVRLQRIYIFLWFHAIILSNFGCFACLLYIFGTNLLTQCQVSVPVFSMFLTPFRGDF